jgi:hypothetical protein
MNRPGMSGARLESVSLHVDGDGAGLCLSSFRWIVHFTLPVRIFVASAESIDGSGISH